MTRKPAEIKWWERAIIRLITRLNLFITNSCRIEIRGFFNLERAKELRRPIVYAIWHGHQFVLIPVRRMCGIGTLSSPSRDGELIILVLEHFGFVPFRGSSSRRGVEGLLGLIKHIRGGGEGAVTVDGPKGPIHEPKAGVFTLCRKAGADLIPMAVSGSNFWRLKSWDRYMIPKPFGSYTVSFGEPLLVDSDDEANGKRLKEALFKLAPLG